MHKIKEMLHHDDDKNTSTSSNVSRYDEHHHAHKDSDLGHKEHHSSEIGHKEHKVKEHKLKEGDIEYKKEHHKIKDHDIAHKKHDNHHVVYTDGVDPTVYTRNVGVTEISKDATRKDVISEPKVVEEKIKEVELHKVQPVIHRDRSQVEVRHVVEPHEKYAVKDTKIKAKEKDIDLGVREIDSTLATSREMGHAPELHSRKIDLGKERKHQELPARLEESVHKKVEEHIHPVVYKETLKPKVVEETQHIYEHVKERPIETYEVKDVRHHDRGNLVNEREFFESASREGMHMDTHAHSHTHYVDRDIKTHDKEHIKTHHKEHKKEGHIKKKEKDVHFVKEKPIVKEHKTMIKEVPVMHDKTVLAHHQNIGAHHVPTGAVPVGHNTAYDAALCDQCHDTAKNVV